MAKKELVVLSHWYHLVEGLQESSQEFYKAVEETVKARNVPDARVSRINYHEGGILSAKREYLRVRRKELIFDICAAPFGTGFFTSWWLGEKPGGLMALILLIPMIGPWFVKTFKPWTYYRMDTALMFQESIRGAVKDVLEERTSAKGLRALSESDWKPTLSEKFLK